MSPRRSRDPCGDILSITWGCRNEPVGNQLPSRPNSRWTDRPVAADCVVSMFPLLKRPCSDQFAGARSQCTDCRHQSATDHGYHWVEEACCQRLRAHHVLVDDRMASGLSGSSLPIIRLKFAASSLRHTNQNNLTFRPSLYGSVTEVTALQVRQF